MQSLLKLLMKLKLKLTNINHSVTYDGDSFIVEILDEDINLEYLDEILLDKEEQV